MQPQKKNKKKLDRLKKRSDFLSVQKNGQKWVSKSLILQVAAHKGADGAETVAPQEGIRGGRRVGFTVTKRVSKSAVVRNRIKRRMRAAVDQVMPDKARDGADYVLIGRADTATRPFTELVADLGWCLRRLGYQVENNKKK